MRNNYFLIFLLFAIGIVNAQTFQTLNIDGFNQDVIANGVGTAFSSTTKDMDGVSYCLRSLDWKLTAESIPQTTGLPTDRLITSQAYATPNLLFQLQDYSRNNAIQLKTLGNTITSNVGGQVKAQKIYILATSASGVSTLHCRVTFEDDSFQLISTTLPDWYDGTNLPIAYQGFGRVNRTNNMAENSSTNPRLYQFTISINLENQTKAIKSIAFSYAGGQGIISVFGATAELVPSCPNPTSIIINQITSNSAQVSFVPPNPLPAAGYDFEVRSSGLPDSGTMGLLGRGSIANSSTTISCSSLPMGERVNFYIRSKCSDISLGEWKGPFTFTTLCAARGAFNESFESQPVGSTNNASLPLCWGKITNGNGYLYTSNASAYSGMHSLYLYNSNQTTGDLMVVSPPTNQLGNGGNRIRFRARSTFFQEVTLKVVTLENPYDTANMQMLDEIELTNSYKEYFVNVPAGTANYFGLAHGLKTGYQAIYIDDIHLEPIPPCIVPTDLTVSAVGLYSATIAWIATSSPNTEGYTYEVRTSGEAGSGTTGLAFSARVDSNTRAVNLTNLVPGTTYRAYVKANCTATDESYWTDAVTFIPNWCMPTYQNGSSNHRITKVNIDELAFTDEITSYTQRDRTNLSIPDLQAGSSYTFNVTTTGYTVMGVAIDFNNDGVFDQNTEVLALPDYIVNNTQVYTAQVIIPNGIASGNYRMRIWNRGANAGGGMGADPCGAYNYGTWADYTVRVQEATLPPVAVNQVFCKSENKKVGDLIATGENIKWYTSETATTALLPSMLLSSGTYYATQTIGGYESVRRTAIQVEVDDPKLNSISVSSSFQYGTQTQVVLIGIRTVLGPHVLTWYETEAGGTSIPTPDINLLPVGTHVYWVSTFSTYGCESKRSKINLVVNPMSIYVIPIGVNKFYGDADPELRYTIYGGYSGVPLTGSLVREPGENVGSYVIRQGTLTATANYSLTMTTAALTISPAPLRVTADAKTKEMGAIDPILTYQVLGLKNGEIAEDVLTGSLTRESGEAVGTYNIQRASLQANTNYTLVFEGANFVITEPIVLTTNQTNVNCNGGNDGTATVTATGGTAPYTYSWNTAAVQTNATVSNLKAGTYTVTITDANGFETTASVTISEPTKLEVAVTPIDVSCNTGIDGTATVTVNGGTAPYMYSWDNGITSNTNEATDLSAGTYEVTVTDANGCIITETFTIKEPTALSFIPSQTDVLCQGATIGKASVVVTGGIPPYSYSWDNGITSTTNEATDLSAGTYIVTVTDANGCTITETFTITEPTALSVIPSQTDVLCQGALTGKASVAISGGTAPYMYSWDNGITSTTNEATDLSVGTYTITVTDANGCTITETFTISEPTALSITPSQKDVLCHGASTGKASVVVSGGVIPYSYSWDNGITSTTNEATDLSAGTYEVTVTDVNGCTITESFTITEPTALSITPSQTDVLCHGASTGKASVVVSGGVTPYSYSWDNGITSTTNEATDLSAGSYEVTVTDANGCTITETFTITEGVLVPVPIAQSLQQFCDNVTIDDLVINHALNSILYIYESSIGGVPMVSGSDLYTGTFYVSQKIQNCESIRLPIQVIVTEIPPAILPSTISVCGFETLYNITDIGQLSNTELTWYANETDYLPMNDSQIYNGTYYVSQKIGFCESERTPMVFEVHNMLPKPNASAHFFCDSAVVSELSATGAAGAMFNWYDSNTATIPLDNNISLNNGTYYVSQELDGCESPRRAVAVRVTSVTPPQSTSFEFCGNTKVLDAKLPSITGVTYNWYLPNMNTPLSSEEYLQTGNYFVSKSLNGCESAKTIVSVWVKSRTSSPTGSITQEFIDNATISDLQMDQSFVIWYITEEDALNNNNPLQSNMPLINGQTYYAALIGTNGCTSYPLAVQVTVTLGLNDFDLASLKYYPNPVTSELTVTYKDVIEQLDVYDLTGKWVKTQTYTSNLVKMNLYDLALGTYMVRIKTNEGEQFIKIVKK